MLFKSLSSPAVLQSCEHTFLTESPYSNRISYPYASGQHMSSLAEDYEEPSSDTSASESGMTMHSAVQDANARSNRHVHWWDGYTSDKSKSEFDSDAESTWSTSTQSLTFNGTHRVSEGMGSFIRAATPHYAPPPPPPPVDLDEEEEREVIRMLSTLRREGAFICYEAAPRCIMQRTHSGLEGA